jgi:hypothetical protein
LLNRRLQNKKVLNLHIPNPHCDEAPNYLKSQAFPNSNSTLSNQMHKLLKSVATSEQNTLNSVRKPQTEQRQKTSGIK